MEKNIIKIIKRYIDVELIYLFGSVVTDRFNYNSDIDIAFFSKMKIDCSNLYKIKMDLISELGREIDLINLDEVGPVLIKEIIYKGTVIYRRNDKVKNEFEYRQLCIYNQFVDDISIIKTKIKERGKIYG